MLKKNSKLVDNSKTTSSSTAFIDDTLVNENEKLFSNSSVYMAEAYLNAERVIMAVVRSVLKKRLQNFKFMGITSSEVS